MSKPWGSIGNWAAEAERAEEEERAAQASAASSTIESKNYPSLKEAVNTKPKKKKMTLSEFTKGDYLQSGGVKKNQYTGLTPDEMLQLPTGPKERSAEEMQYGRLGGGFSSFNRSGPTSGRPMRDRDDGDGSWGGGGGGGGGRRSYGGFDDERRGPPARVSDFDQPSRADEVDNWAMTKKSIPSLDQGRPSRYGRVGGVGGDGGESGGFSRADEVDNWAIGKKTAPTKSSSFGSGFRDSGPEQNSDRWSRGSGGGGFPSGGGLPEERPRLVLDRPKGDSGLTQSQPVVKTNRPSPFGAARPREQVLADKGLDWKKLDSEIDAKKTSTPTSAHSSRPSSAQSSRSEDPGLQGVENVVKPRAKVNPFGDAKPREVLLEERGQDWRKIDLKLEHRRVDRPETEEEKMLKEEIDQLKKDAEKESSMQESGEARPGSPNGQPSLEDIILQKEKELEMLIRDFDDKVRFQQKASERPGSGAGRVSGFFERPPSHSGSVDESNGVEFMDRPRSRGTPDAWRRPNDERKSFQGGRGFHGNRDNNRPRSRDGGAW